MGQPPLPRDPNDPYAQQPYAGPMPPPPQVIYVQAPAGPGRQGRQGRQQVHAKRGMSLAGHGMNWTLTIFTCGMWLPMYWCWWVTVRSFQAWRNWRNRKRYNKVYG